MSKLIGTAPNQVPTNGDLGTMAYMDYEAVVPVLLGGRRNLIINGAMQVWQRGTSFSSGGYTADRWFATVGNVTKQSFTLGSNPSGLYCTDYLSWSVSSAVNNEILQRVENVTTAQDQTVTLSFWAKSNTGTETFGWAVYQNFGTGGSALTLADSGSYTPSTSWQRFTFTFTMPSLSGKTIGTNSFVWVRLAQLTTNNAVTLDIAGAQLELGSIATPFEHRSYGEELALCQRYYTRFGGNNASSTTSTRTGIGMGYSATTTETAIGIALPVEMRTSPSVSFAGSNTISGSGYAGTATSIASVVGSSHPKIVTIQLNHATTTANVPRMWNLRTDTDPDSYLDFDAEL